MSRADRYLIFVQGGGSGNNIAQHGRVRLSRPADGPGVDRRPERRYWRTLASTIAMETFMKTNGVRAAQVAFGQNGTTEFARAYTWAEPGYRVTQPGDRFLLASCSKMFCEAVIQASSTPKPCRRPTSAYAKLALSHPADPRSDQITIQELLDHTGGYDDTIPPNFDPTYNMGQIAQSTGASPLARLDVRGMYSQPQHDPGTTYAYSNYGYLLLAAVADAVTPQRDYYSYLQAEPLQLEDITEVGIISTLASSRTDQEAIAEDPGLGMNALDPHLTPSRSPACTAATAKSTRSGRLMTDWAPRPGPLARRSPPCRLGQRGPGAGLHELASTPGASTYVWSRADGVDAAFTINTRFWPAHFAEQHRRPAPRHDRLAAALTVSARLGRSPGLAIAIASDVPASGKARNGPGSGSA